MTNTSHTQFDEYQKWTRTTAAYPDEHAVNYCALGLGSEVGEVQGLIKKVIRDNHNIWTGAKVTDLIKELGDVIWSHDCLTNLVFHFPKSWKTT